MYKNNIQTQILLIKKLENNYYFNCNFSKSLQK